MREARHVPHVEGEAHILGIRLLKDRAQPLDRKDDVARAVKEIDTCEEKM